MNRFSVFGRVIAIAVVLLAVRPACAQWTFLTNLPQSASTVYFLDKQGTPKVGFVGMTSGILRTSDGGQTWSVPLATGFSFRDFAFWDSLHGIAVCAGANGVFLTADGGINWWQNAWFGTRSTSVLYLNGRIVLNL